MAKRVAQRLKASYRARSVSLRPFLVACATFAAAGSVLSCGTPAKGIAPTSWIIGQSAISLMAKVGESAPTIRDAFANQSTFVYGDTAQNRVSPSAIGVPTIAFGSYRDIVSAFSSGLLPGKFEAVIYDNEHWAYTPLAEQQDPAYYEQQTARLLHAHGLAYIAAPAPDLMWAVGRPSDSYRAFLAANMAASAARYADIYDIQAQQQEDNLPYFTWFVTAAATQARAANPHVKIFVGIRSEHGSNNLLMAYQASSCIADGYWLNVNGIPGPANDLINAIYQPSSGASPCTSLAPTSQGPSVSINLTQSPATNGVASTTGITNARAEGSNRMVKDAARIAFDLRDLHNQPRRVRLHCKPTIISQPERGPPQARRAALLHLTPH
jgi:hypothetical protein